MAIRLQKVSFSYPGKEVLREVSLTLPERGTLCLSGPSGCGKTTLLRILAGLEKPQSGRLTNGEGTPLSESVRAAVVFQENRLLPWMSVLDNVAVSLHGHDSRERAQQALEQVGLREEMQKRPSVLSGGMRRRVALARALAFPAQLLLLDEPFTGLDAAWKERIAARFLEAYAQVPIVLVTHVPEDASALQARVLTLQGPPLTGNLDAVVPAAHQSEEQGHIQ